MTCPPDHKHGKNGQCYVTHGCKCDDCRAGRAAYEAQRNRNKAYGRHETYRVPAQGTRRRAQALVAIGWSLERQSTRLGYEPNRLRIAISHDKVRHQLHTQMVELFEQLWNQPPTGDTLGDRISRNRARNHARTRKWLPPMAWDDIDNDPEPTYEKVAA